MVSDNLDILSSIKQTTMGSILVHFFRQPNDERSYYTSNPFQRSNDEDPSKRMTEDKSINH